MKTLLFVFASLFPVVVFSQNETLLYSEPERPAYKDIKAFDNGTGVGVINDATFETIMPFEYQSASKISDAMPYFIAMKGNKYGVLDVSKKAVVIDFKYQEISFCNISRKNYLDEKLGTDEFVFKAKQDSLWGFIDVNDKAILPFAYSSIDFNGKLFFEARRSGKWGVINVKGVVKVPFLYDELSIFSDNAYKVRKGGLHGVIDANGKAILPLAYVKMERFEGLIDDAGRNRYLVTGKDNKSGIWDSKTLTTVIKPKYDRVIDMRGDHFIAVLAGKYGVVNKANAVVIPFSYDALRFLNLGNYGKPVLAQKNGKFGLVSAANEVLVPFSHEEIQAIGDDRYKTCSSGQCQIIDGRGKVITQEKYDHIGVFVWNEVCVVKGDQMTYVNAAGAPGPYRPSDVRGYTNIEKLFEEFVVAFNSRNDTLIQEFCRKVVPDQHTVDFMTRSRFDYGTFKYSLRKKDYTLESLLDMYSRGIRRLRTSLENRGIKGPLHYDGRENDHVYLLDDVVYADVVVSQLLVSDGNAKAKIRLGKLVRVDGLWKAFSTLPSVE